MVITSHDQKIPNLLEFLESIINVELKNLANEALELGIGPDELLKEIANNQSEEKRIKHLRKKIKDWKEEKENQ